MKSDRSVNLEGLPEPFRPAHWEIMPLRIGLLMDHPSPHMVSFLDALGRRDDCAVEVIYFGHSAPERRWGAPAGSLPHRFMSGITVWGGFRINPSIISVLNKVRADVWIINTCYTSPSTLLAARCLGQKRIPWVYMNEPPQPRGRITTTIRLPLLRFVLSQAWGVISMGRKTEAIFHEFLSSDQSTTSIPYYVDFGNFFELPLPTAPVEEKDVEFITTCQMIKRKGLDVLLRACELLPEKGWRLTLVGDGPLRRRLEKEFGRRWKKDQVKFIGEIPYEGRESSFVGKHVFVLSSRWDGWGMVVPEALAAGLPVITTDRVISAHEFIRDSENGFIIPAEDAQALAWKMLWFLQNKAIIPTMGLRARASLKDYLPDIGAEQMVNFLSKLTVSANKGVYQSGVENGELNWKDLTTPESGLKRIGVIGRYWARKFAIHGIVAAMRPRKPNGHRILAYHLVLKEDRERFEEQIKFLTENFKISSIAEVFRAASKQEIDDEYCVAITFDDGFRVLMGDCLEVLEKFGIKACFFVPTGFVELSSYPEMAAQFSLRAYYYSLPLEPMRPEDLKLLVDLGHEVGSHGISHTGFSALSQRMADRELKRSKEKIVQWTSKEPAGFAYPYGHILNTVWNPSELVRGAGYEYAVTLKRGAVRKSNNPFLLPRDHAEGNWSVRDLRFFLQR